MTAALRVMGDSGLTRDSQLGFLGRKKRVGRVLELAVRSKDDTCHMSGPSEKQG